MSTQNKPNKRTDTQTPKRSVLEEVGNSVTHGVGALFAVAALVLMLAAAVTPGQTAGAIVYFTGLFLSMTASCLYHAFPHGGGVKRLFRRFDYISIYLLIGATFAPILIVFVGGAFGYVFLSVQWAIIAVGVVFVAVFGPGKFRRVHITSYIVLGWSGLLILPFMIGRSMMLLAFILGGGAVYSLGIIPFALKKRGSHFIWHFFVLAGALTQWLGIYFVLYA